MANLAALLPPPLYGLACVALVGVLATLAAAATEPRADRQRVAMTAMLALMLVAPLPLWAPALAAATLLILPRRRRLQAANDNVAMVGSWIPITPEAPVKLRIVA